MAWRIKSSDGGCCPCEERPSPCDCGTGCTPSGATSGTVPNTAGYTTYATLVAVGGGPTTVLLQCRTRGGTAELCGHDEFGTPSAPPRKYRRKYTDHSFSLPRYTANPCTTPMTGVARSTGMAATGTRTLSATAPGQSAPSVYQVTWTADGPTAADTLGCSEIEPPGSSDISATHLSGPTCGVAVRWTGPAGEIAWSTPGAFAGNAGVWTAALVLHTSAGFPPNPALVFHAEGIGSCTIEVVDIIDVAATWSLSEFSAAGCVESTDGETAGGCSTPGQVPVANPTMPTCALGALTVTPTLRTQAGTGACCARPSGWGGTPTGGRFIADFSFTEQLSVEDTEADAIARLLAGTSWSGWAYVGGGGCPPESCCAATYSNRTAFTFTYGVAEWRLAPTGQPAGCHTVKVQFWRAPTSGGAAALYAETGPITVLIDESGNLT